MIILSEKRFEWERGEKARQQVRLLVHSSFFRLDEFPVSSSPDELISLVLSNKDHVVLEMEGGGDRPFRSDFESIGL